MCRSLQELLFVCIKLQVLYDNMRSLGFRNLNQFWIMFSLFEKSSVFFSYFSFIAKEFCNKLCQKNVTDICSRAIIMSLSFFLRSGQSRLAHMIRGFSSPSMIMVFCVTQVLP